MSMILAATTSSIFLVVVGKKVVGFRDEKEVVVLLKAHLGRGRVCTMRSRTGREAAVEKEEEMRGEE
ncbi:hypothetical protein INR49_017556 [Caranx melampygus]|nr:hypothetical protein INR49_017556 [Caranx melampygus]